MHVQYLSVLRVAIAMIGEILRRGNVAGLAANFAKM
jgi:hypothetical protein